MKGKKVETIQVKVGASQKIIRIVSVDPFGKYFQVKFRINVQSAFYQNVGFFPVEGG